MCSFMGMCLWFLTLMWTVFNISELITSGTFYWISFGMLISSRKTQNSQKFPCSLCLRTTAFSHMISVCFDMVCLWIWVRQCSHAYFILNMNSSNMLISCLSLDGPFFIAFTKWLLFLYFLQAPLMLNTFPFFCYHGNSKLEPLLCWLMAGFL